MKYFLIPALALVFLTSSALGQTQQLTKEQKDSTLNSLIGLLKTKHAYPEIALKMEADLLARQKRGEYDKLADGKQFAERVTSDLRAIFNDKHLKLSFSETPIPERSAKAGVPTQAEIEAAKMRQRRQNFGVVKVEILQGNVGYLQINYFAPLAWSADTYSAAFTYLANTDALVIDVRSNTGSMDINSIPFFCSYLFESPVIVGNITTQASGENRQLWTYAKVPGPRYVDKPLFVLTGPRTASGAEGFVSALRSLKRATLVGQTTAGATMPGGSHRVNEHFSIWISTGRSSQSSPNEENKGTVPDIETDLEKAIVAAHSKALETLMTSTADTSWKAELEKVKREVTKGL